MNDERFNEPPRSLYKVEYVDEGSIYVDWVWATEIEVSQLFPSYENPSSIRRATSEEADLYEEAYADGYGVAAMLEFESRDDGITFRIEVGEDGELKNGKKMFECGVCAEHKDYEKEAAFASGFYVSVAKDDILWHVCMNCAFSRLERDKDIADELR